MKAGAVDFLTKPVESAVLLQAIETALIRDQAERRDREKTSNAQARYARLTQRERSVFDQVVAGRLNKQIADQLGISERTVKMHRAQVMAKMEARSPAELFQMADVLHQARRPAETPAPRD
jgi:FixJ family two-component response regulator